MLLYLNDNQQRPIVEHIESLFNTSLGGMGAQGHMDPCICMAESLRCLPETVTILLIDFLYLIQNVFGVKNINAKMKGILSPSSEPL